MKDKLKESGTSEGRSVCRRRAGLSRRQFLGGLGASVVANSFSRLQRAVGDSGSDRRDAISFLSGNKVEMPSRSVGEYESVQELRDFMVDYYDDGDFSNQLRQTGSFHRGIFGLVASPLPVLSRVSNYIIPLECRDGDPGKIECRPGINEPEKPPPPKPIYSGKTDQSEMSLTFDDGYFENWATHALDVLKEHEVKSTFFIVGSQIKNLPKVWERAVNEGHQICNHTYGHPYLSKLTDSKIKEEFDLWETMVRQKLGSDYLRRMKRNFPWVRFPYGDGHANEKVLRVAQEYGYRPVAWGVGTWEVLSKHNYKKEACAPIAEQIRAHVVGKAGKGTIALVHFNCWETSAIRGIIEGIKDKGLKLVNINEVIA